MVADGPDADLGWLEARSGLPTRIVRTATQLGPAGARNRGWRIAHGELVAFTDDDCRPDQGWIENLVAAFDAGADVVQGRTAPDPVQRAAGGPFSHTVRVDNPSPHYPACNIAYRRGLLEELDGFDPAFGTVGDELPIWGEDADLGWRARKRGARIAFAGDALVLHDVTPSDWAAHLRSMRRRAGLVRVVRRHPELRRHLHGRFVFHPSHVKVVLAALGIVLGATSPPGWRRWLAGALTLPYARFRLIDRAPGVRTWPYSVPGWFVADLAEVAVMIGASVRERTLLL